MDITDTLTGNSEYLTAADILAEDIIVVVTGVRPAPEPKRILIDMEGRDKPWYPSLTNRRLLSIGWGAKDTPRWHGCSMRLHHDPTVAWAGKPVGGVMLTGLSGIDTFTRELRISKTQTRRFTVERIPGRTPGLAAVPPLDEILADNELTRDDVDRWLASTGQKSLSDAPHDGLPAYLLDQSQGGIDAIRALIPVL